MSAIPNKTNSSLIDTDTLERIVPNDLESSGATGCATYKLHLDRYRFAANHLRGTTLLDIACGVGYGTYFLVRTCPQITHADAADISKAAITYAKERYSDPRIHYHCDDGMNFGGLSVYDTIVSLETIEHVPHPAAFVSHLASLLKHGGVLVASVPTTPSMDGNPHHLTDFTERSFRTLGSAAGLREIASLTQTQSFNPRAIATGVEKRLERTKGELLKFYVTHPQKMALRFWTTLRNGFVNRYLTVVWEKDGKPVLHRKQATVTES